MRPDHPCHNGIYASVNTEVAEQVFSYLSKFKHSFGAYKVDGKSLRHFVFQYFLMRGKKIEDIF